MVDMFFIAFLVIGFALGVAAVIMGMEVRRALAPGEIPVEGHRLLRDDESKRASRAEWSKHLECAMQITTEYQSGSVLAPRRE